MPLNWGNRAKPSPAPNGVNKEQSEQALSGAQGLGFDAGI